MSEDLRRLRAASIACLLLVVAGVAVEEAAAVLHLKRGMAAPEIALADLDGAPFASADLKGGVTVLVFGELYHRKTLAGCKDIRDALASPELRDEQVRHVLVITRDAPVEELKARAADHRVPSIVLHDVERRVFGVYRVAVLPSVVVVDGAGQVVHAHAGYTPRFKDIVADAVRVATGKLTAEQFERSLRPDGAEADGEAALRAQRLTGLARQLVRRGLDDLAEEKYREVVDFAPTHVAARLGLAAQLLRRGRLADAETEYAAVLEVHPTSLDARLGRAFVQMLRGGAELTEAEDIVRGVLVDNPSESRAHYLMGRIHQTRGRAEEASSSFRRAAELLLGRQGGWPTETSR